MNPEPLLAQIPVVMDAMEFHPPRSQVIRTGQREPISPLVRSLVYRRDGHKCRLCPRDWNLCLDHVVPWSAGGSDRTDNLRTLCWDCNRERSNYPDRWPDRNVVLPCVAHCIDCQTRIGRRTSLRESEDFADAVKAYCGRCGFVAWAHPRDLL